jgi:hypothetical protein
VSTPATADTARSAIPLAGNPVEVVIAGGWRLRVSCAPATHLDEVVMIPVSGEAALPGGADRVPAVLEWKSAMGLVRRSGLLTREGDALVLVEASDPDISQRRSFARVRCELKVVLESLRTGEDTLARTVDLSIGGMLVQHAGGLDLNEPVRFTLGLPDLDLRHTGKVVRSMPFGYRAIQFDRLRLGDEQRLSRYVFAQEREGRAVAGQDER